MTSARTPPSTARAPRGYVPRLALASLGLYLGLLAPLFGGLSAKVQQIVGLDDAATQLGLVTGAGALFAMVCQPLAGRLSDRTTSRWGMRRPWIVGGSVGMFVSLVAAAAATSMPGLLVAWCCAQLFANAAFAALTATIADQVPETSRGRVSGVFGAASPAGILVGSVLLTLLPSDLLRFTVPASISLVAGLLFAASLRDRVRADRPRGRLRWRDVLGSFVLDPRANPDLAWAWLTKFLVLLGYGGVSGYLTLYLGSRFGMGIGEQLAFNAIANILSVGALVLFSVVGGVLSDRSGRRKPFVLASGLVIAAGTAVVACAPLLGDAGLAMVLVGMTITGIGAGTFFAVDQALCIALLPDPAHTAKDLGVLNVANTLAQSLAPFLAGVVVIPLGAALTGDGYSTWFAVSAAVAAVGALLVVRIKEVA